MPVLQVSVLLLLAGVPQIAAQEPQPCTKLERLMRIFGVPCAQVENPPMFLSRSLLSASGNIYPAVEDPAQDKPRFDETLWQKDIWIEGERHIHGVEMHPKPNGVAWAEFEIPPGARFLLGVVGLAQYDGEPACRTLGKARARAAFYGIEPHLWTITPTRSHLVQVEIPDGAETLRLETDSGGSRDNTCDHVTWGSLRYASRR